MKSKSRIPFFEVADLQRMKYVNGVLPRFSRLRTLATRFRFCHTRWHSEEEKLARNRTHSVTRMYTRTHQVPWGLHRQTVSKKLEGERERKRNIAPKKKNKRGQHDVDHPTSPRNPTHTSANDEADQFFCLPKSFQPLFIVCNGLEQESDGIVGLSLHELDGLVLRSPLQEKRSTGVRILGPWAPILCQDDSEKSLTVHLELAKKNISAGSLSATLLKNLSESASSTVHRLTLERSVRFFLVCPA